MTELGVSLFGPDIAIDRRDKNVTVES